jgi:hypothetical protein
MLKECPLVTQPQPGIHRRWFVGEHVELVIFLNPQQCLTAFQLFYLAPKGQKAFCWHARQGYGHYQVDDGEHGEARIKATPVMLQDGECNQELIARLFSREAAGLENSLAAEIQRRIGAYQQ